MVRGPLAESSVSMACWPAARRLVSIFSKAAMSGLDDQIVGCVTLMSWAERTAANNRGRHKKIARRTANNMKEPRGEFSKLVGAIRNRCLRRIKIVDDCVWRCQARGRKNSLAQQDWNDLCCDFSISLTFCLPVGLIPDV